MTEFRQKVGENTLADLKSITQNVSQAERGKNSDGLIWSIFLAAFQTIVGYFMQRG